jgi:hypothetical protein
MTNTILKRRNTTFKMTSTMLKIFAMLFMLFDHIWIFIPNIPYFFHWIGRLSAPIFIYCCVLGFINTKDKKKYIIRLYVFSLIIGIENYLLDINFNFIRTLFLTSIILFIVEKLKCREKNSKLYLFLFIFWQIITSLLITFLVFNSNLTEKSLYMIVTVLFNIFNLDGGILFILLGVAMFVFKDSNEKLLISFILITCIFVALFNTNLLSRVSSLLGLRGKYAAIFNSIFNLLFQAHPSVANADLFYGNPQWMMIFSLIFIFMYNGEKGKGFKYLFYIFYPLHIAILFFMQSILF